MLGVPLDRARLGLLVIAAVLTAAAVCAVGVLGVRRARRAARRRGRWWAPRTPASIPVAVLLGALLVSVADTVGRTVIAPAQIPAGLLTALIGAPYFVWLLWRTRRSAP